VSDLRTVFSPLICRILVILMGFVMSSYARFSKNLEKQSQREWIRNRHRLCIEKAQ